jgi:hypothetical protein
LEFGWDDVFRSAGWDCRCPVSPEQVQNMPRELSPYQWTDKKIIIKLDSADLKFFEDKKFKLFTDSTQLKKKKPIL